MSGSMEEDIIERTVRDRGAIDEVGSVIIGRNFSMEVRRDLR